LRTDSTLSVLDCERRSASTVMIGLGAEKSRRTIREPVTVTSSMAPSCAEAGADIKLVPSTPETAVARVLKRGVGIPYGRSYNRLRTALLPETNTCPSLQYRWAAARPPSCCKTTRLQ